MAQVLHGGGHLRELLEVLLVRIGEDRVCTVAFFLLGWLLVDLHLGAGLADLLHGEFDPTDLQNVLLLNFVVL